MTTPDALAIVLLVSILLSHLQAVVILRALQSLSRKVTRMDANTQTALDNLNAAVADETTIEQSVETLLNGLSAQIAELKAGQTDPAVVAALDAASALVRGNNDKFKAAVLANTPAA